MTSAETANYLKKNIKNKIVKKTFLVNTFM